MSDDPFAILALTPTLDVGAIKRAYFAALAKSPPHVDAARFRLVRDAYESLCDDGARRLAFLRAPIDEAAELARFDAQWGERLRTAKGAAARKHESARAVELFIERVSRARLPEVRAMK